MQALQIVISGMAQGCIYGLIALGLVLIYKTTETVSFAHGELMMLGAFAGLGLMMLAGFPFWIAFVATVLAMGVFGIALERVVIRPILGQPASVMSAKPAKAPSIISSPWAKLTVSVVL